MRIHQLMIPFAFAALIHGAPALSVEAEDPPEAAGAAAIDPVFFELQVRGLPSGGRAWRAMAPVNAIRGVQVQNVDGDRSRVVIRVRGPLNRDALEQALAESSMSLVYIEPRNG